MAFTTYTVTGNILDGLQRAGINLTRLAVYAEPSQEVINDASSNLQQFGNVPIIIEEDGTFVVDLVETSETTLAGWTIVVVWRDQAFRSVETTTRFGPFPITANRTFGEILADGYLVLQPVDVETLESVYSARDDAEAAAVAAAAVGTTNDTIMASRANDPTSAFSAALAETISARVSFYVEDFASPGFVWGVDDTAPWQAALNAARDAGGAQIYANPTRVYKANPLKFWSDTVVDLRGATVQMLTRVGGTGVWDTLFYSAGCTPLNGATGDGVTVVNDSSIINGTLDTFGRCYATIKMQNASRVRCADLVMPSNQNRIGIRIDYDTDSCVVERCSITSTDDNPFGTITNAQGVSIYCNTGDSTGGAYGAYGTATVNTVAFTTPTNLSRRHKVAHCTIIGGTHGVAIQGGESCVVIGNTFNNTSHRAVILSGSAARNKVSDNVATGRFSCAFLAAFGSHDNTFSNNIAYCTDSVSEFNAFRASYGASYNLFVGNYAYGVTGAAYRTFTGANHNAFISNKAVACGVGIDFRALNNDSGYWQNINTPAMTGNLASGNDVAECGVGIQVRSGTTTNTGTTPATSTGVQIPATATLLGNRVRASTTYGVLVTEDTAGTFGTATGVHSVVALSNSVVSSTSGDWQTPRASAHWTQFQANAGGSMAGVHRLPTTGNSDEWRDPVTDAIRVYINNAGGMGTTNRHAIGSSTLSSIAAAYLNTIGAGNIGYRIDGQTAQTADLMQWTLNASHSSVVTPQSRIDKAGRLVTSVHSAPADADLATGEVAFWFDQTSGAAKVKFKAKDAGGTVRTGEVALA